MNSVHVSTESQQTHGTPRLLIGEISRQFSCSFTMDLAANAENKKCDRFFSAEQDSLKQDWKAAIEAVEDTWLDEYCTGWLNPPFRGVDPWMEKCKTESAKGCRIISLTLASMGTGWYRDHVEGNALSLILRRRVTFEGQKDAFPKELMITLWGFGMTGLGFWTPPAFAVKGEAPALPEPSESTPEGWLASLPNPIPLESRA